MQKIKELFFPNHSKNNFYAVRNVSFEVREGETIGFIGINGSGKSTMSNLLAKIIPPTEGNVYIDGQPSLIAIAAGLNNALSGKDNIFLKCLMMGLSNKEISEIYDDIVEFADIGDFIDQPVKSYSSGMKSRLGFAISVHIEPDILIIDEALSVGDQTFYQKCINAINDFKKQGKTIFFVSHSIAQVEKICDRVAWMHYGEMKMFGDTQEVVKEYKEFINWYNKLSKKEKDEYQIQNKESRKHQLYSEMKMTNRSSSRRKSKKGILWSYLPVLILSVLLVGIGASMFSERPLRNIVTFGMIGTDPTAIKEAKVVTEQKEILDLVNENGYIISEDAVIYNDAALTEEASKLPFGSEIVIKEKNGETAHVLAGDKSGYMESANIDIREALNPAFLSVSEFNDYFSDKVADSYQFLLSFVGRDKQQLMNNLLGYEEMTEGTQQLLYLPGEDVQYIIDQNGQAISIVFNDFRYISPEELQLDDDQYVMDMSKTRYSFSTDEAMYVIDGVSNQLRYTLK